MATLFPKSWFPSLENSETECEPIHSILCRQLGLDPLDSEAGAWQVDAEEAIEVQNFPPDPSGDDQEIDWSMVGEYYFVSNSSDGYGYLVHFPSESINETSIDPIKRYEFVAPQTCWRRNS